MKTWRAGFFSRRVGKKSLKAWYMWDDLLEGVGANFGNQSKIFAFGKMLDFNLTGCLEDLYVGTFL